MKNVINKPVDITVTIPRLYDAPETEFNDHTVLIPGEMFVEFASSRVLKVLPWECEYEFIGVKKLEIFDGACDVYKEIHADWVTGSTKAAQVTDDAGIEQLIQAKGKTAARVTPADVAAAIKSEHYFTAEQGNDTACALQWRDDISRPTELALLTFCVLVLRNGFTVTGESACASPENFDSEIGKKVARENAVQKIWPLKRYQLKNRLHEEQEAAKAGEASMEKFNAMVARVQASGGIYGGPRSVS